MKANINIHNYEEYFLLYADGELSVEEMAVVEGFVKEHPELQPAFDALLATKLNADDKIAFNDKDLLFKTNDTGISFDNYEEYFLLYVDDELSDEQKTEIEKFVLQHPALQNEFTVLKQTILPNETVEFAGKESLYKKEEAVKSMISIGWKHFAVAASVIGLIFSAWIFYPRQSKTIEQSTIVTNNKPQVEKGQAEVVINQSSSTVNKNNFKKEVAVKNSEEAVAHLQKNNQIQKNIPVSNVGAVNNTGNNDLIAADEPRINAGEIVVAENNKAVQPVQVVRKLPDSKVIVNAGLKTMDKDVNSSNDGNDDVVYVANIRINKNKIPNILKRARSILHFNGNDDNGIAIANFTISK